MFLTLVHPLLDDSVAESNAAKILREIRGSLAEILDSATSVRIIVYQINRVI